MSLQVDIIRSDEQNSTGYSREEIAGFLYEHLDQYGDSKEAILNCISYAYGDKPGQNGFVILIHDGGEIRGAGIVNDTNMAGYIPEHILVYIAVAGSARGQGLGKKLMETAIRETKGDLALHVEPDNPARYLYEKYGFTNKYLEMRRTR